jgi:hypothetical protein
LVLPTAGEDLQSSALTWTAPLAIDSRCDGWRTVSRSGIDEKGGELHNVPAHHNAEDYMEAAGIAGEKKPHCSAPRAA